MHSLEIAIFGCIVQTAVSSRIFPSLSILAAALCSFVFSFSLLFTWKLYLWPIWFSPLRNLPEPPGGQLLSGHVKLVPNERSGMPLQEWINEVPNTGLIRYRMRFNKEVVFVTSPKGLSEVLVQKSYEFAKPAKLRLGLGRILGVGLIVAEGSQHKKQRKLLMPAFLHRHIKDLYPIFWDKSVALARVLSENISSSHDEPAKVFDVADWLARATLDILGSAGLGEEFDTLHHPDNEICSAYRNVFEQKPPRGTLAMGAFFVREAFISLLGISRKDSISMATKTLTDVARRLIARKRSNRQVEGSKDQHDQGRDIISVMLASDSFTDPMLENHLLTFLAAGHETTATSMTWALYALCLYPNVQQRLRDEVRKALPQHLDQELAAEPMKAELLDSLPYLHAVCNEVFRIYPPAGLTRRVAVQNTSILGQFIPAGTEIVISPRAVNVSKDLWGPDAATFNPDRWMKPSQANTGGGLTNFSFMTFLHGPRSCIGQGFARGEFASLLAALVGSFEMSLAQDPDIVIETGLTSRPKGGLLVQFRKI
ncbi:Cytochrome P450 monooxygenase [Penicillium ucsense]|uniref:Cytochrome P450 monooxygenase n=1 Tax=Penicillium ucsense TaxID=2839758 RepID=A0A8J8W9V1_9EURO|nr:Cytochrome P450 monooxygenase [Penicillium ucsense]KAF7736844.1 Cytochrome P450 monooxygenase [Penicillium ucsense]